VAAPIPRKEIPEILQPLLDENSEDDSVLEISKEPDELKEKEEEAVRFEKEADVPDDELERFLEELEELEENEKTEEQVWNIHVLPTI